MCRAWPGGDPCPRITAEGLPYPAASISRVAELQTQTLLNSGMDAAAVWSRSFTVFSLFCRVTDYSGGNVCCITAELDEYWALNCEKDENYLALF